MEIPASRRAAFRTAVLTECGAAGDTMAELLAYTENAFTDAPFEVSREYPLPDEPHLEAWQAYAEDGRRSGAFEALRSRLVQLRFPIRAGISDDENYRAATRKGRLEAAEPFRPGLVLRQPERLELALWPTIAGRIPVLVAPVREDFVSLVQALTSRNEPEPVPPAMGACIVSGLNNWDRIASYRAAWESRQSGTPGPGDWPAEFGRLVPRKELYQDRFIILSREPYSAVSASEVGLDQDEWLDRSLTIRREHEFFHYLTYRVFGVARNNLHDELIADFVGLIGAFGRYSADLALRFLGLESFPRFRPEGRLESYRGSPALTDAAMGTVRTLAYRAVHNLEVFAADHTDDTRDEGRLAGLKLALARTDLAELASSEMSVRVERLLH